MYNGYLSKLSLTVINTMTATSLVIMIFLAVIAVEPSIHAIEQTSAYAREIYTEMMITDKKIKFQIECGASINIITKCHTTKKSRNTIKQNPEDVEWNRNEIPQNYPPKSHES